MSGNLPHHSAPVNSVDSNPLDLILLDLTRWIDHVDRSSWIDPIGFDPVGWIALNSTRRIDPIGFNPVGNQLDRSCWVGPVGFNPLNSVPLDPNQLESISLDSIQLDLLQWIRSSWTDHVGSKLLGRPSLLEPAN